MSFSAPSSLCALALAGTLGMPPVLRLRLHLAANGSAGTLLAAHGLEHVEQPEIDLAAFHVHADDLHADLVTQTVCLPRVLAVQDVQLLHVPIVVVRHAG